MCVKTEFLKRRKKIDPLNFRTHEKEIMRWEREEGRDGERKRGTSLRTLIKCIHLFSEPRDLL